jgi:hypothetical protein
MSKTDRLYKIEMLIRSRGHVSFATLRDELEVSTATSTATAWAPATAASGTSCRGCGSASASCIRC